MNRQQKDDRYERLSFIESAKTEAEWARYQLGKIDHLKSLLIEVVNTVEAAKNSRSEAERYTHLKKFEGLWAQTTEMTASHGFANRRILADHDQRIRALQVEIYGDAIAPPR